MQPRVSILIPAYNVDRFIDQTIASVKAQTFTDWEVVAVDDASPDTTLAKLRAHESSRIRVEPNPRNLGMTGNWNRCLSLATGELVLKLDSDDALKPRALEQLVNAFDENREIVAAGSRTLQCDVNLDPFDGIEGDDAMQRGGISPYRDAVLPGERWWDIAAQGYQLWSSTALMIRRDLLQTIGGWDERFGCASDTEMIWRVLEQRKPVAHRGAVGALYRIHQGSISDTYRANNWLTWEAVAGNLLTLHRVRTQYSLRRGLRMHYVRLWQRWHTSTRTLPPSIAQKLNDVVASIPKPPMSDVLMTKLRDGVSAA